MDRSIVFTQEQGRSTDFLFAQRSGMVGLSKVIEAAFGTTSLVSGLSVVPTSPASLSVWVNPGQIFATAPLDATAYGVLAADTTHTIVKQGLLMDQATLACPAPATAGNSINYLIQSTFQENDTTNVVLPYFNSANPSQPLSGQTNSGAAQATERQGVCVVAVKAGASAVTGTQTTPAPDAGYVGLAVVTVANGQATIIAGNIVTYSSAPYITETLTQKIGTTTGDARYAKLAGLSTQSFSVANATTASQAVALGQFTQSLVANGYQKLPGGLIVQWVTGSSTAVAGGITASATLTYPIAFPNGVLLPISGVVAAPLGSNAASCVVSAGLSSAVVNFSDIGSATPITPTILVVGY